MALIVLVAVIVFFIFLRREIQRVRCDIAHLEFVVLEDQMNLDDPNN